MILEFAALLLISQPGHPTNERSEILGEAIQEALGSLEEISDRVKPKLDLFLRDYHIYATGKSPWQRDQIRLSATDVKVGMILIGLSAVLTANSVTEHPYDLLSWLPSENPHFLAVGRKLLFLMQNAIHLGAYAYLAIGILYFLNGNSEGSILGPTHSKPSIKELERIGEELETHIWRHLSSFQILDKSVSMDTLDTTLGELSETELRGMLVVGLDRKTRKMVVEGLVSDVLSTLPRKASNSEQEAFLKKWKETINDIFEYVYLRGLASALIRFNGQRHDNMAIRSLVRRCLRY